MICGTGKLWKAAAALLLALVVSPGTLGVAQASHPVSDPKPGWYEVGGSAADRMLSKDGGVIATWTHVKLYKDYSQRAYWTVKNTSSSPQKVGCAGYQHYGGLKGYKVKVFYHATFNYEWRAKDAKCAHLGGAYRQMLEPGQTITSWADFKYAGKKGTCTALTLPTGPKVPEHVGYTKCVDPYAHYLGHSGSGPPSPSSSTALLAPFDEGTNFEVLQGYYNNRAQTVDGCHITRGPDHCRHQLFGLDLKPLQQSNTEILAPAPGTVAWPKPGTAPECLGLTLDDGLNLTICHFSSYNVEQFQDVPRGKVLGTMKGHVHISLDKREGLPHGEWLPVPFNKAGTDYAPGGHTIEGESLDPNHTGQGETVSLPYANQTYKVEFQEYKGGGTTSTNVRVP